MTIEIKVPVLPESVADATIATWHVKAGDAVKRDQNLVDIETDKVVLEVVAPADGTIGEILNEEGATVLGEQVIAKLEKGRLLILKKCDNNWCNATTDSYSGWIKAGNIWGSIK